MLIKCLLLPPEIKSRTKYVNFILLQADLTSTPLYNLQKGPKYEYKEFLFRYLQKSKFKNNTENKLYINAQVYI